MLAVLFVSPTKTITMYWEYFRSRDIVICHVVYWVKMTCLLSVLVNISIVNLTVIQNI